MHHSEDADGLPDLPNAGVPVPPRTLRLLVDRTFGPYFAGKLIWSTALWIHNVAAAIAVFELTRSALVVGMVSVGHFLPQIVISPWSGARADRGNRRRQVVVGRIVSGSGASSLVMWIIAVGLDGPNGAVAVILATVVTGIGDAIGTPATQSLVPVLVRPGELPSAVALDSVPFPVARAAGPALGATIAVTVGPAFAFGLVALAHLVFAVVIATIPIRRVARRAGGDGSVRAGLAYVRNEPSLLPLLLGVAVLGIGADPMLTLTPAISESLGRGSEFVGALASAFGLGALLAFLLLGRVRRRFGLPRAGTSGLLLLAAGMLALAASGTVEVALAATLAAGSGYTLGLTSLTTLIQARVAEELRGRIMALWTVALLGTRPVAATLNGAIADRFSAAGALAFVAIVVAGGARVSRPSKVAVGATHPPGTRDDGRPNGG